MRRKRRGKTNKNGDKSNKKEDERKLGGYGEEKDEEENGQRAVGTRSSFVQPPWLPGRTVRTKATHCSDARVQHHCNGGTVQPPWLPGQYLILSCKHSHGHLTSRDGVESLWRRRGRRGRRRKEKKEKGEDKEKEEGEWEEEKGERSKGGDGGGVGR